MNEIEEREVVNKLEKREGSGEQIRSEQEKKKTDLKTERAVGNK